MLANSGQMWFYHAPLKRTDKSQQQFVPATSQVPGLSALDPLDEEAWKREVGIKTQKQAKESDSKYIRLAKQGGRKNLLMFNAPKEISDEPKAYPRVDWFDHHDSDPDKDQRILSQSTWQPPEYMVHDYETMETRKSAEPQEQTVKPKRAPFYTDNMSAWKRTDEEESRKKKTIRRRNRGKLDKLPEIPMKASKSDPVAFSKLIGGGYGTEWYQKQAGRGPVKTKIYEAKQEKGYLNMSEYQQSICRKEIPPKKLKPIALSRRQIADKNQDKEFFKLSKFSKVESKLKSNAN